MLVVEAVDRRLDLAAAAAEHRRQVELALRSAGAPVLTLRTDRDWIADVVRFADWPVAGKLPGVEGGTSLP